MDLRAVIFFLWLLHAVACGPVNVLKKSSKLLREDINNTLVHLNEEWLLPNVSSIQPNATELLGGAENFTVHHLSSFRCYLRKLVPDTQVLKEMLLNIIQQTEDMERRVNSELSPEVCSLPHFEQELDGFLYLKHLLKLLHQALSVFL